MPRVVLRLVIALTIALPLLTALPATVKAQVCDNIGCDPNPPIVTVSGGSVINPVVQITINWCDDNALVGSTKVITLNGGDVTSQFSFVGTSGSCQDNATSTGTVTLSPGTNTIGATIEDYVGHVGSGGNTYIVLNGGVSVNPKGHYITKAIKITTTDTFAVTNIGVNQASFNLNVSQCSGRVQNCSLVTSSPITLQPSETGNVAVQYTTHDSTGTGVIGLRARLTTDTTVLDSGWINVTTENSLLVDGTANNNDARNLSLCEHNCATVSHAISTVPYYSLGQPQGITLVHNSDWTDVFPILRFDIGIMPGAAAVDSFKLVVLDSASLQSLTLVGNYGSPNTVKYTRNNADTSGLNFRMTTAITDKTWLKTKATGIYTLRAMISAVRGTHIEIDTLYVPLLIVRDPAGAVARGWHVAGIQRLHVSTGGRRIVTEPGGSAFVFTCDTVSGFCNSPAGDFTRLSMSGNGAGVTYTRSFPDSSRAWFSASGTMDSVATAWGVKTRISYSNGRPARIYDPFRSRSDSAGKAFTELVYLGDTLVQIQPPKADGSPNETTRMTKLRINADTTLRALIDPDGDSLRFTYTSSAYLVSGRKTQLDSVFDRNGKMMVRYEYDGQTRKLWVTWRPPLQLYDGNASLVASGIGFTWNNLSSPRNLQSWELRGIPGWNTMAFPQPMWRVDSIRTLVSGTGGKQTRTRHDRWGQVLDEITNNWWVRYDPVVGYKHGGDTTFYNRSGLVLESVVHPMKSIDSFLYGTHGGRPVLARAILAGRDTVLYNYDQFGHVSKIHGNKITTEETFRSGHPLNVTSVRIAGSYATTFTYDAFGRNSTVADPSGHTTTFTYDATSGNLALTTRPGARVDSVRYDGFGRDSVRRSHGGHSRTTLYDNLNRLISDSTGGEPRATLFYAASTEKEFFTHLRDAQGQIHKTSVNSLGWPVRIYDVADTTKFDSLMYNQDGQLSGKINRRGQRINYLYDNLLRFKKKHGPQVTIDSVGYDYVWSSGTPRRREKMIVYSGNAVSSDSLVVDSLGWTDTHLTKFKTGISSASNTRFVRTYTRNALLLPEETRFKIHRYGAADTTNGAITFCKRKLNWTSTTRALQSVELCNLSPAITLDRNNEHIVDAVNYPTATQALHYTTRHELSRGEFSHSALAQLNRGYAYGDSLNRITELSWNDGVSTNVRRMEYSPRGELSTWRLGTSTGCPSGAPLQDDGFVCTGSGFSALQRFSFSYDSAGNLRQQYDSAANTTTAGTYAGNRLQSWGGTTYSYDADGNMLTRVAGGDTTFFSWSGDNRLTKVRKGADSVEYDYNAAGQLVRRKHQGVIQRHFLWDDDQLVAEVDTSLARIAEYAYWPGIDHPLALVTGPTAIAKIRYYDRDAMGNVSGLWDATSGTPVPVQNLQYEPWGLLEASSTFGTLGDTSRVLWKGLAWEGDDTKLYFVRNRWFDPEAKRFVSEDPIGIEGGLNVYSFGNNDPINRSDPLGLHSKWRFDECRSGLTEELTVDVGRSEITSKCVGGAGGIQARGFSGAGVGFRGAWGNDWSVADQRATLAAISASMNATRKAIIGSAALSAALGASAGTAAGAYELTAYARLYPMSGGAGLSLAVSGRRFISLDWHKFTMKGRHLLVEAWRGREMSLPHLDIPSKGIKHWPWMRK